MFSEGDKVIIKHQKEQGVYTVTNPNDPTDIVRVGSGEPVGHYVRISNDKHKDLGYHEESLERVYM